MDTLIDDADDERESSDEEEKSEEPVKKTRSGRTIKETSKSKENKDFSFAVFEYKTRASGRMPRQSFIKI